MPLSKDLKLNTTTHSREREKRRIRREILRNEYFGLEKLIPENNESNIDTFQVALFIIAMVLFIFVTIDLLYLLILFV